MEDATTIHEIRAELAASVLEISQTAGDQVRAGDVLLLLESMKMEIPVLAEMDGDVYDIPVSTGVTVRRGDCLIRLHAPRPDLTAGPAR